MRTASLQCKLQFYKETENQTQEVSIDDFHRPDV
jgi:hypothetical protein